MTIYVAEIGGHAICAFDAEDEDDAESFIDDDAFKSDLLSLEFEERPLWNGKDPIDIRIAHPQEAAMHDSSNAEAMADDEGPEEDDVYVTFLIAVTDPRGEEEEDDDDADGAGDDEINEGEPEPEGY
jgi:hypothetical protein